MKNLKLKIQFIKYLIILFINKFKDFWLAFKFNKIQNKIKSNEFNSSDTENINETLILNNQQQGIIGIQDINHIRECDNAFFNFRNSENKFKFIIKNEEIPK